MIDHGKPLHLDLELSREEYESMILPLVESTLDSVSKALDDAGKRPGELDAILLVGGSTRTPLVSRLLRERTGLDPARTCIPTWAWPWAPACWPRAWPAATWSACWWMCRPTRSARRTWASAAACRIRIVITPSFAATRRCR